MKTINKTFKQISQYPSAVFGLFIIMLLVILAVYAMATIPYSEAIRLWRGGEDVVYMNPKNVPPAWVNIFRKTRLPESFAVKSSEGEITKTVTPGADNTASIDFEYPFEFDYDVYPQELMLYFTSTYASKNPFVSIYIITPTGEELRVGDFGVSAKQTFRFSQDERFIRRLVREKRDENPMIGIFSIPETEPPVPQKGTYKLFVQGQTFEANSDLNVEFVLHGQSYGLAGTDHARRDLMVALLWGAPIALAFGLLAALATSILSMAIAAIGAWYGGWLDELIQRITEVNLVLPFLAILIMVGTFYTTSIWTILGVTIALSIFTGAVKSYRAVFLQVKESTYIEAAKAYGASNFRIVFLYLIPRMIPLLIPTLVSAVPAYVFLEASLALLGLGDPVLPTWGKVINDAYSNGALYKEQYYWILEPAVLLMITGLGFAMLGFALDRIFNPRLRGI
ncbi:MAG TPA: ABC transporter permease [Bellilinea sp.]